MAPIPDKMLMTPEFVARQIELAYKEGVVDTLMELQMARDPKAPNDEEIFSTSIAKTFSDHYKRIASK